MNLQGKFRLDGFEKITAVSTRGGYRRTAKPEVSIVALGKDKKKRYMIINHAAMEAAGFKPGDKVDLYVRGTTFALERSPAGLYTITMASKSSKAGRINSVALCLEISSRTNAARYFTATAMGGILFFEPEAGVAE